MAAVVASVTVDAVEDGAVPEGWLDTAAISGRSRLIVLALTRRAGERPEDYAARILATPGALLVKEADLAHNADPARLAELDGPTARRLAAKYAAMRALLGVAG